MQFLSISQGCFRNQSHYTRDHLPFHDKGPCCSRCQLVAFSVGRRWFAYPADEYISYAAQGHTTRRLSGNLSFVIATEIALINADVLVSLLSYLCNVLDNFFRKGLFMDFTLDNTATSESVHLIHLDRLE